MKSKSSYWQDMKNVFSITEVRTMSFHVGLAFLFSYCIMSGMKEKQTRHFQLSYNTPKQDREGFHGLIRRFISKLMWQIYNIGNLISRIFSAGPWRLKYSTYKYFSVLFMICSQFLLSEALWHWLLPTGQDGSGLQTPTTGRHILGLYILLIFSFFVGVMVGCSYISALATIGVEDKIVPTMKSVTQDHMMSVFNVACMVGTFSSLGLNQILPTVGSDLEVKG